MVCQAFGGSCGGDDLTCPKCGKKAEDIRNEAFLIIKDYHFKPIINLRICRDCARLIERWLSGEVIMVDRA